MFNFNTSKRPNEPELNDLAAKGASMPKNSGGAAKTEGGAPSVTDPKNKEVEAQRVAFMKKRPDFDIVSEMENNEQFVEYVWYNGLSVEDAYFLTHRDEIIREEVEKELERIAARKDRIVENGASKNSPAAVKMNPKEMSDKEIDDVIRRARNGEKISF